jgi:3-hydroxybutyrate dehydrogenase
VTAVECANDGINCNAICPGWVLTPLVERQLADRAKQTGRSMDQTKEDFLREKQPMLAFSTPESIGALTVFLCGDAAVTMTGSAYSIDGGWVAQ